jgi:hypothetical protein
VDQPIETPIGQGGIAVFVSARYVQLQWWSHLALGHCHLRRFVWVSFEKQTLVIFLQNAEYFSCAMNRPTDVLLDINYNIVLCFMCSQSLHGRRNEHETYHPD